MFWYFPGGVFKTSIDYSYKVNPRVNFLSAYYARYNSLSGILHINLEEASRFWFQQVVRAEIQEA